MSVCLFVSLPAYLYVCLSVCPSVCLSVCLFVAFLNQPHSFPYPPPHPHPPPPPSPLTPPSPLFLDVLRGDGIDDEMFDGFEDSVGILVGVDDLRLRKRVAQLLRKGVVTLKTILHVRLAVVLRMSVNACECVFPCECMKVSLCVCGKGEGGCFFIKLKM